MEYVPLIYFSLLFIWIYKKNGLDASAYIALLYVMTSFFSVLFLSQTTERMDRSCLTFIPTFLYCTLLTFFILPVTKFNTKAITISSIRGTKFINFITYFYFACFFLLFIFYLRDLIFCFFISDMAEAKQLIRTDGVNLTQYPWFIEIFLYTARMLSPFSMIMIFIFFYGLAFLKKSWGFNLMALIGSFSAILIGILNIDRSKIFFWVIIFGLCAVMFWNHIEKKRKKALYYVLAFFGSIMTFYFVIVTIGRYGDSDVGAGGSLISYAGQPYYYFCYFWENFNNPDGVTLKYLFPSFHHFILHDFDGSLALQQELTTQTGIFTGQFYTLLGDFIISDGKTGPFIITIVYLFLSVLVYRRKGNRCSFERYFVVYLLMLIPTTGIISYYYANFAVTFSLIAILLLLRLLSSGKRIHLSAKV